MGYTDLLKDPRWQKKRLEVMNEDGWKCMQCDEKSKTLVVHHIRYIEGLKPWEYDNSLLLTVCEDCHDFLHERGRWEWVTHYERMKRLNTKF